MNFFTFTLAILQLCCTIESQKNIARNGTASQSSVWKWYNSGNPTDMTADLAITGLPTNDLFTKFCSITDTNFYEAWWMLTFPVDIVFVITVKIFYRKDTLYRFALYSLYISNTSISTQNPGLPPNDDLCYHDVGPELPSMNQSLDCHSLGKNVIIYNNRTKGGVVFKNDPFAYLELCGVQVFGCYKGWFGNDCSIQCPSVCIDKHCFPNNGTCVWGCVPDNCLRDNCDYDTGVCVEGCKPGLAGKFCNESCSDGYFGDCKSRCYCLEGVCNKTTGICPGLQCQKGWMGDTCNKALSEKKEISQNDLIYAVVGTFMVTVVVCIAIFLLFIWRQRRQNTNAVIQTNRGHYENNVFSSTSIEPTYEETIPVSEDHQYDITGLNEGR